MFLLARRILNFIAAALLQQVTLFPRDDDTAATTVSSISTTSPPTTATSYYELLATEKIQSIIQDTASSYTRDKSQAELIFVSSVIIAVFVFVIVLPVLEAYFLRDDNDEDVEEQIRRYYSNVSRHQDVDTVNKSPPPQSSHQHTTTMMRVYQPGQGVVEMSIDEVIEMTALLRECSSSLSSSSSTGTAGSMETIYEEEEEEVDENDDELDSLLLLPTPTSSPPLTPETKVNNSTPRFIDEEFKRRLFQSSTSLQLPPLSSSSNHLAPQ